MLMSKKGLLAIILVVLMLMLSTNIAALAQAEGEQVTVLFWDMKFGGDLYPEKGAALAEKITEEYPNIKVEYQSIPWSNNVEIFATAIAAGEGPDISTGNGYQCFQYAATGDVIDVSFVIDDFREEGILDLYNPVLIDYYQYRGMQVAFPWQVEPRYFIYRVDWFEEAGIAPPKTWDELFEAAAYFTDADNGKYGLIYPTSGSFGGHINNWLHMNGGGTWTADGKMPDWTNPRNIETANYLRKYRDAGMFPEGMASYEGTEILQMALQDKTAMVPLVLGAEGVQYANAGVRDKWAVLDVPEGYSADGHAGYYTAVNSLMAYKSDHEEQTKIVFKWWLKNLDQMWYDTEATVNGIPVRSDWLASPELQAARTDPFGVEVIETVWGKSHTLLYPATKDIPYLTQANIEGQRWSAELSQAILTDPRPVEEILQDFQDRAIQLMKDNGEYPE